MSNMKLTLQEAVPGPKPKHVVKRVTRRSTRPTASEEEVGYTLDACWVSVSADACATGAAQDAWMSVHSGNRV